CCRPGGPCPSVAPLVAGWTDDPHHLGPVPAGVHDAMRRRAPVVDAVAALELVDVAAELELHVAGQHDEQLFRVTVRVWLGACRAAWIELSDEHLQVMQRPRRKEQLAAENAERERGSLVATKDTRPRRTARLEQVRDRDAQRPGDPPQRSDARACLASLDLTEEALADPGAVGDRAKCGAAELTD